MGVWKIMDGVGIVSYLLLFKKGSVGLCGWRLDWGVYRGFWC